MSNAADLLPSIAAILRDDPDLRRLAPNWGADDARAHVFVGEPPIGATNAGRAPFVAIDLADVGQGPRHEGDRKDALVAATVVMRLIARSGIAELAASVRSALLMGGNGQLGDPAHVLTLAIETGTVERLGRCEAADLRLKVRLLAELGI